MRTDGGSHQSGMVGVGVGVGRVHGKGGRYFWDILAC
jgi:hypothetical protein